MAKRSILDKFSRIELPDPTELVLEQIQSLIRQGELSSGDRLPSDRRLEEKMCLPRGYITKAMKRLETFGIVYTVPQSGTYISDYGNEVLDGLLSNVIKVEEKEFNSLADLRFVLEKMALSLAAERVTDEMIRDIEAAQEPLKAHLKRGDARYDHDILFHLSILKAAGNPVLQSVVTKLCVQTLDILKAYETERGYGFVQARLTDSLGEHQSIIDALKKRDKESALKALHRHFVHSKEHMTS